MQNFVSAAVGIVVSIAIIRGMIRTRTRQLGNFWVDLVRTMVRILLPLALIFTVVLMSQGVIQNFHGFTTAHTLESVTNADGTVTDTQLIPGGPFASQEAIKELGTNGGGPLNANSAHPFENPNAITDFFEIFSLLLIPFVARGRRSARWCATSARHGCSSA